MLKNKIKKFVLFFGDMLFAYLALVITLSLRYGNSLLAENMSSHLPKFLIVFVIWLLALYLNSFYNLNFKAWSRVFLRNLLRVILFSSFFSILYFYLATDNQITPKTNLFIFLLAASLLFVVWRQVFNLLIKNLVNEESLAIIGLNEKSAKLLLEIKKNPGAGYKTALIFKNTEELELLVDKIKEKNIKTIVICDNFGREEFLRKSLFKCLNLEVSFFNYHDFYEYLSGKVPIEAINNNWFLENIKEGEKNYFNTLKNAYDFLGALLLFIITLPFWPLIALAIKLESRGPVFFQQVRLGKNEKEFKIIKFRTMRQEDNHGGMTIENDKRITMLGSFLRKTRIDEIPQVLNIIRGEMSFIGPRPERPELANNLEKEVPFYKTRLLIKPGLSGWDQVSSEYHSPSTEDTIKKLQNDLFYIKNRSFYLDMIITLKTISAILSGAGR